MNGDDPLAALGWDATFEERLRLHPAAGTHVPARVVRQEGAFVVDLGGLTMPASVSGRLKHEATSASELPIVGDWVLLVHPPRPEGALMDHVLARKTLLARRRVGRAPDAQPLAANVDVVLVVLALDHALNLGLVERAVALTRAAGIEPIVVLNKADLCADPASYVAEVQARLPGVLTRTLSAQTGQGADAVADAIGARRTATMMGPSGVGKSSLVNQLFGDAITRTGAIREHDHKGRHTTTHRELFRLPNGALIIDGPGIRELALSGEAETLDDAFPDVLAAAQRCAHRDCRHASEPDCAVRAELADGRLPARRWSEYTRLRAELADDERQRTRRGRRPR